jgi:hypothetical protein
MMTGTERALNYGRARRTFSCAPIRLLIATAFVLGLGTTHAEERQQAAETFRIGEEATSISMSVIDLREEFCGGQSMKGSQDAKNATFIGCVMYVLGVVDMLREWQIDPVHDHIEATAPWREQQLDATTAVIAALKAKWPCPPAR